jgi:hypothetical protein
MKTAIVIFTIWLLMSYITGAALWANWYAEFYGPNVQYDENSLYGPINACRHERSEWATIYFTSAIPIFWVGSPFITGFYVDGFKWDWVKVPCTNRAK